jgi:hypothetical protein
MPIQVLEAVARLALLVGMVWMVIREMGLRSGFETAGSEEQ